MKPIIASAASLAAVATFAVAAPASAQEVEVRNAVARVVVIVEDRTDVGVEIEPGTANLPAPRVIRRGDQVRIDGDLGRNAIRNCRGGSGDGRQPGEGASVELRRGGRIELSQAPLIVLRTPRDVEVSVDSGAVHGSVGRGARSISVGNKGCGNWTVASTTGSLELSLAGSGNFRAGSSRSLEANIAGSGNITTGATRELEANIAGSGNIDVARVDGRIEANILGSGNINVRAGDASDLEANIMGSGDIDFRGRARNAEGNVFGSGDIRLAVVTGNLERATPGSGRVIVGP